MKLKLDMNQKPKRVETALDIKIEKQMLITQLNALLQKLAVRIWNQSCKIYSKDEETASLKKQIHVQQLSKMP
jgi:cell division protein FtsL